MDLRNICCTTFCKLESLLFPFLFFISCLCNKIIRWDVASNSAPADNIEHRKSACKRFYLSLQLILRVTGVKNNGLVTGGFNNKITKLVQEET